MKRGVESVSHDVDVAIIGFGPAGEVLASTLGEAGFKVLVVERWPQPYPLPRLTTLDGECCRIVQATSADVDRGFQESCVQDAAHFLNAEGQPLMRVLYPGHIGGWPARVSIFQPDFERGIADKVEAMANVEIRRGWEMQDFVQDEDGVTLTIAPFDAAAGQAGDKAETFRARYMVGTDGARSSVREKLGVELTDFNLHERWLNFDAELKRPLPEHFNRLAIFMDPARPHMYMPIGERYLRLEFRVMEGETDEQVTVPEVAWEFLTREHGLGPDDVRIMRQVVYHYYTRLAQQWRVGRVFLAGDAAHTFPPYMGQGGCAAIRDGRNLGWKLIEVLSGRSEESLLDLYQIERMPHLMTILKGSDMLSRVVNVVDSDEAAQRNKGMREQGDRRPPDLPGMTTGILQEGCSAAGSMTPQGILRKGVGLRWCRGDDLLGTGFQIWASADVRTALNADSKAWLAARKVGIGVFGDPASPDALEDCDGVYGEFLRRHGCEFVILRPDFFAFGGGAMDQINAVIADLACQMKAPVAALTAA
ncbi:bifunctional 3-(3-hydroxy-phenyl)propionate/3-hydroxycinnamic acid hydroxylase [Novosphingobium umbonatum]|uniref:Bifunctional 3-(3-hydroxy-phenyl)propionate/3-hydroxycinnamic acid hydroxylase n=1 Tax=Novosphingobium umbonatum TaxID=1908524 RepID=A0A437MXD1_9SPHN|nr:bifunctional 3-(3-hydroxy-phenyl)propionate/3-hydroxycinnamic acid hydroxylase [Novosphingobium umbonatum]RVU02279.1 bifunctional 3-(3-hydroxy-phenyl)propionate/3-hydroxycinnamic acid hydroxylase [Novosphingobium umbonatum]